MPTFDYTIFEGDDWQLAKRTTQTIRNCVRRSAEDIIDIGKGLSVMRGLLPGQKFAEWLRTEFEWDRATAYRYISVAEKIGDLSHSATLAARTLYLLASDSTPPEVRDAIIAEANAGVELSHKDVKARIETARKTDAECQQEAHDLNAIDPLLIKYRDAEPKPRRIVSDDLEGGTMATLAPPPKATESQEPVHRLARQARKSIEHLGELLSGATPETAEAYREARAAVLLLIAEV